MLIFKCREIQPCNPTRKRLNMVKDYGLESFNQLEVKYFTTEQCWSLCEVLYHAEDPQFMSLIIASTLELDLKRKKKLELLRTPESKTGNIAFWRIYIGSINKIPHIHLKIDILDFLQYIKGIECIKEKPYKLCNPIPAFDGFGTKKSQGPKDHNSTNWQKGRGLWLLCTSSLFSQRSTCYPAQNRTYTSHKNDFEAIFGTHTKKRSSQLCTGNLQLFMLT